MTEINQAISRSSTHIVCHIISLHGSTMQGNRSREFRFLLLEMSSVDFCWNTVLQKTFS